MDYLSLLSRRENEVNSSVNTIVNPNSPGYSDKTHKSIGLDITPLIKLVALNVWRNIPAQLGWQGLRLSR